MRQELNIENQPQRIKIEEYKDFSKSIFKDVYSEAGENVGKIAEKVIEIRNEIDNEKSNTNSKSSKFYNDIRDYNNVIAFTGDRGVGKTSAMISFVNALDNLYSSQLGKEDKEIESIKKIRNAKYIFTCLKVIEPSNFVRGERLFEIVLSNIFSKISEILNDASTTVNKDELKKIYELLDKVQSSIRVIYADKKDLLAKQNDLGSGLEALEQLSVGEKLKNNFGSLVEEYLTLYNKYVLKNNKKDYEIYNSTFLVIPIDDLDMNLDNGYEMAEEIRKYLITRNVIVTMALNIGQFTISVQQKYFEPFKDLIQNKQIDLDTSELAGKYLTKLIPTNRRLTLPSFDVHSIANLDLKESKSNTESDTQSDAKINLVDHYLGSIYKKTGILLLKNESTSHEIIPTNLRELVFLNKLLEEMEDSKSTDTKNILYSSIGNTNIQKKLSRNLEKFEDYFTTNYISSNMPKHYSAVLLELMKQSSENMNKYLVRSLVSRKDDITSKSKTLVLNEDINSISERDEKLRNSTILEIISPDALPQNISIGDVLFILQQLIIQKSDYETKKFVAGVKIIYSIRMIRHLFIDEDNKKARVILGEFLYNTENIKLMRTERGSDTKRDVFIGNVNKYVKDNMKTSLLLNCLISRYSSINSKNDTNEVIVRKAYKFDYSAAYNFVYNGGSTGNLLISLTSFILNLIDLSIIKERIEMKNDDYFIEEEQFKTWKKVHVSVIPVWSIDFINTFIYKMPRAVELRLKDTGYEYINYVSSFLDAILKTIEEITDVNTFLSNSNLEGAFLDNPVLSPKNINNSDVKDVINNLRERARTISSVKLFGKDYLFTRIGRKSVLVEIIKKLYDVKTEEFLDILAQINNNIKVSDSNLPKGEREHLMKYHDIDLYINKTFEPSDIIDLCNEIINIIGENKDTFKVNYK